VFPLKAADLMSRGLAAGPELGAALRLAEEFWIEAGFPLDRATLEALADRTVSEAVRLRL
jgi:hypothetical protein